MSARTERNRERRERKRRGREIDSNTSSLLSFLLSLVPQRSLVEDGRVANENRKAGKRERKRTATEK